MPSSEIKISKEDAENIPHSAWRFIGQNESMRYWEADVQLPGGKMGVIRKGEYLESALLMKINEELRKESTQQRHTAGMGTDRRGNMPMVQTASIPNNVYFQEIAPRIAKGDRDFLPWFLNRPENKKFLVTEKQLRKTAKA